MAHSQRKPKSRAGGTLAAIFAVATLVGCTTAVPKGAAQAEKPEPVQEEETAAPEPSPGHIWPLTGVAVEPTTLPEGVAGDPAAGEFGPALSVKIENSPGSRPQRGLDRADVVWEELVEGGMTRFVAMYHSDVPETLGPIRSVRPMDAAIAGPVGGVLAFSGGVAEYVHRIRSAGLTLVSDDAGSPGFFRNPERRGDHRLFGYPHTFLEAGVEAAPPPELFTFADDAEAATAVAVGTDVARVDLHFPASHPSWQWGPGAWQRLESGAAAHDELGARIEAANVVIARVAIRDTGNRDGAGSMVPETILAGEGTAVVFTGGRMVEGRWHKEGDTDLLLLRDEAGEPIALAPGKTWVELLPTSGSYATS